MKRQFILGLALLFALLSFQLVSADIITPTTTEVYFTYDGNSYEKSLDFSVKGYGYSYSPGIDPGEPDNYTPEVVYSFSAEYDGYGDTISEDYYRNYRHIEYYTLEGETSDGKTFTMKNISEIPTSCDGNSISERECEWHVDLSNANWNGGEPEVSSTGLFRRVKCFFTRLFGGLC